MLAFACQVRGPRPPLIAFVDNHRENYGVEARVEFSFCSVGDSYDNAPAETITGHYKAELIHRRGPRRSFEAVKSSTLAWVLVMAC